MENINIESVKPIKILDMGNGYWLVFGKLPAPRKWAAVEVSYDRHGNEKGKGIILNTFKTKKALKEAYNQILC